jgi:hypothetical protein
LRHKRYYMRLIFFLINVFILNSILLFGQTTTENRPSPDIFKLLAAPSANNGEIQLFQAPNISNYIYKYIDSQKKENSIPGYRIRIFSNSGQTARAKARSERDRFTQLFPDIPAQNVTFETPNFKVYVGDFRTKTEAFRAFKQIAKEYKNAFIVPARINLPKL